MSIATQLYALRWLLIAAALTLYGVSKYRTYKRLAEFQGPPGTGWSELWHIRAILSKRAHMLYKDANDTYGM
jgi:hypothetical protein